MTEGAIPELEDSFAAIAEVVAAVHIVGKLADGELAQAVRVHG